MTDDTVLKNEELTPTENTDELTDTSLSDADDIGEEASGTDTNGETNELEALQSEIATLRAQLSEMESIRSTQERIMAELGEFAELFPATPVNSIPESVWSSVKQGAPLLAAYALYEKRATSERERIARINQSNAARSPGIAGKNTTGEYFTPDEVRSMSPAEVHANYSKIKESMKKWI